MEALPDDGGRSALALTLLRAVGWLSRGDLALRPGDAGPPLPTPAAQVPGRHRLAFALRLHPVGDPRRVAEAHAFAYPPLPIRRGERGAEAVLPDGARLVAVEEPALVVSAFEPRAGGGSLVRCYDASGRGCAATVGFGLPGLRRIRAVDLAERPLGDVREGPGLDLTLRPFQILALQLD